MLLDVDVVTIGVENAAAPPGRLGLHGIHLLGSGSIDALLGAERNVLLQADTQGDPALFGGAAGLVRSQALLRLGFGRGAPAGLLCIGTRQNGRFHPGARHRIADFSRPGDRHHDLAMAESAGVRAAGARGSRTRPARLRRISRPCRNRCRSRGFPRATICAPRSVCG